MGKWIALAVVGLIAGFGVSSYYGAYGYGSKMDNKLEAEYTQMENVLAQYSLKVKEAVQIPKMKTKDLEKVMASAFQGRYGKDGSKATFQWIQENYPGQVTDAVYTKIQVLIEAGRNKFENAQKAMIDTKRQYKTVLDNDPLFTQGWMLKNIGFPKVDLAKYEIISSSHAKEAFETKVDKGLDLLN